MSVNNETVFSILTWLGVSGSVAGLIFYLWRYWRSQEFSKAAAVAQINALLPQTQCGYCGHPGCLPYAEAIFSGEAINKCAPGGRATIAQLALLLQEPRQQLDPRHGEFKPAPVAYIREPECIGCTKCIQACPVDAILGAAKLMHTVLASECTGCDLCVDPCPVDCIEMRSTNAALMESDKFTFRDRLL